MYCKVQTHEQKDIDQIITNLNNVSIFDFSKYTKIKLLCNFCSSKELSILWKKMTKGNLRWNKITSMYKLNCSGKSEIFDFQRYN